VNVGQATLDLRQLNVLENLKHKRKSYEKQKTICVSSKLLFVMTKIQKINIDLQKGRLLSQ
jgi:hypothetical protein